MGKSIFEGAINGSSFKNKGVSPTGSTVNNGEPGYQKRTSSPNAQAEVTYVNGNRLPKAKK